MQAGLPILARVNSDSDLAAIIYEESIGLVCDETIDELKNVAEDLTNNIEKRIIEDDYVEFKKDLVHDFGHNDGDGYGHIEDEGNENENNLINRIGDFIDKHTPKNWDANIHKENNSK